jgi:hypothetical protein
MWDFQIGEDVGAAAEELVAELEEGLVGGVVIIVFFVLILVVVVVVVVVVLLLPSVVGAAFRLVVLDFGGPGFVEDAVV